MKASKKKQKQKSVKKLIKLNEKKIIFSANESLSFSNGSISAVGISAGGIGSRTKALEQSLFNSKEMNDNHDTEDEDFSIEQMDKSELNDILNLKFLLNQNHDEKTSFSKKEKKLMKLNKVKENNSHHDQMDGATIMLHADDDESMDEESGSNKDDESANENQSESDFDDKKLESIEDHYVEKKLLQKENESLNEKYKNLPIKTLDGKVIYNKNENLKNLKVAMKENDTNDDIVSKNNEPVNEKNNKNKKATENNNVKKKDESSKAELTLNDVKEQIANISALILEEPNLSEIKSIFTLLTNCKEQFRSSHQMKSTSCKIILLSLATIFLDIIPGYRIVKIPNEEMVSKEVKKLREFEDKLLSSYQHYLSQLEKFALHSKDQALKHTSLYCLCRLLSVHTHFNYALNIMSIVVDNMNCQSNLETAKMCCDTIGSIFKQDESGFASLECVKLISEMIYKNHFHVLSIVIDTMQYLRLQKELSSKQQDQNQNNNSRKRKSGQTNIQQNLHVTKKMKKVNKHLAQVMQEVKEAEAVYSTEQKQQVHSQTLHHLFLTLFRILKKTEPSNPLIPSVLLLLSKYAHLISIDYFTDMIKLLKDLCTTLHSTGEGFVTILHAVTTAFTMLETVGNALFSTSTSMGNHLIDLRDFYQILYEVIGNIVFKSGWVEIPNRQKGQSDENVAGRNEIQLICRAFQSILRKKNQINIERVTAFVKRILTVSLSSTPATSLHLLPLLEDPFIRKSPKISALFEGNGPDGEERGAINGGLYDGYIQDPDLTRVFGTSFWEIAVLQNHYHPQVRSQIASIISTKPKPYLKQSVNSNDFNVFDSKGAFRIARPGITIPPEIQSKVMKKEKWSSGKGLDGPTSLFPSTFLNSILDMI